MGQALSIILLHQLTGALKKEPPARIPKPGEYAEDTAFDAWLQYCIGLGTSSKANVVYAVPLKARGADTSPVYRLYFDGSHYQFWDVTDM